MAVLTLVLFFCLALVGAGAAPPADQPPLLAAAEIEYPPFCFLDQNDQPTGFAVELLQAAGRAVGREVTFRVGAWADVKNWLAQGQVQVLPLVGQTPEREAIFDFTVPYLSLPGAIVVRRGKTDIHTLADLRGQRVAVRPGDNAAEFLRRENQGLEIHTTPTFVAALQEVAAGHCAAVVMPRLVALWLLQKHDFANLEVSNQPLAGFRQDFRFAVKEGDRQTLALLHEGLAKVVADGTYRRLQTKWFASLELPSRPLVMGGDHNYPPFEYLDDRGQPAGFNVDLSRAIAREMHLNLEIRFGSWDDIVKQLAQGDIDVVQGMYYSPQRAEQFDFSQPYLVNHYFSVVQKGKGEPPTTVAELGGKSLVAQRGDIIQAFLSQHGLTDRLLLVENQEEVLRAVAAGRAEVGLVIRLGALYFSKKEGLTDLVLGRSPLLAAEYCYAVRRGNKAILAQFSEGLKVLAESGAYRQLQEKWFGIYRDEPGSLLEALRSSAIVVIPLLLSLGGFFLWSWSLRRQVAKRTAALRQS
ncbi:MAG: transporter substrate-binding domain-containing protein, partial [Desulfobacca sp.]